MGHSFVLLRLSALLLTLTAFVSSQSVTDRYVPACSSYADPPPGGWKRWSSPATWPTGVVPGVGSNMGVDVTIPCNSGIVLDLNITVGTLDVRGSLRVQDNGPFQVFANFIVNQGRIRIGSASAPYTGKIVFNITGSASEYIIPRDPSAPSAPAKAPRSLGTRAVITLGGTWDVNGMYGNNPGWTSLARNANVGDTSITVRGNVGAWPVGGEIAIASTDFDYLQAERRRITSVSVSGGTTTLGLNSPLAWGHWGRGVETGIPGVSMDQSAEVMLLTRSIVFQGHPNALDPLIGAHFIISQTPARQSIIGIELVNMGQQGRLGRYPLHFHLCQDVQGSLVKAVSVHDSLQRCYVVHGTQNARLEGNGAFNTKGHCYMVEDGFEFGNSFIGNLGFSQEPPRRTIDTSKEAFPPLISDSAPSTFWITNANNTFLNNVAAGSFDSGWWFESLERVSGPSRLFPGAQRVYPKFIGATVFDGNVAHSNGRAGLRTYPSGYRPKINGGFSMDQATSGPNAPHLTVTVNGFRAYKNDFIGLFIHETDSMIFNELMVADNGLVGLELNRAQAIEIKNSIFLGETENVGNPRLCGVRQSGCRPNVKPMDPNAFVPSGTGPCSIPTTNDPSIARAYNPELLTRGDLFGILMDADDFGSHGRGGVPFTFSNLTFGKFYSYCRNAAAGMTANGAPAAHWTSAHNSRQIRMIDGSAPLWMVRPREGHLGFEPSGGDAGAMSFFYVWRDLDGSLVGGRGGYAVTANNPAILPAGQGCTHKPEWNAYLCPNTCYRTLRIQGVNYNIIGPNGEVISSRGSMFINLAAGTVYKVDITGTVPSTFSVSYMDYDQGCREAVILQFESPAQGSQWGVAPGNNIFYQACNGVNVPFPQMTQTRYLCDTNGNQFLEVVMGGSFRNTLRLQTQTGNVPCGYLQCGLFPSQSVWSYNDTYGASFRVQDLLGAVQRAGSWKSGKAMFGFGGVGEATTIARPGPGMVASYYRINFNVNQAGCINRLVFGYVADDAIVVYVNGREAFRTNLPATTITPGTTALTNVNARGGWNETEMSTDKLILRSGSNYLVVALHTNSATVSSARFDMWLAAAGKNCPGALFYNPYGRPTVRRNSADWAFAF